MNDMHFNHHRSVGCWQYVKYADMEGSCLGSGFQPLFTVLLTLMQRK